MAKISTYSFPATPSASDYVIGTDTNDSLATKNFMISDIIALAGSTYVPYTGATTNVDLGANSLTTSSGILLSGSSSPLSLNGSSGTSGYVLKSNGPGSTPSWISVANAVDGNLWKGSFYDSLTQTLTGGANVAHAVILRQTDTSATNGISIVTDGTNLTRITFANTAVYNLMFSAQLQNSGGTSQTVDFWLRKNGNAFVNNVADSNGKVNMQGNASYLMAAWNYFISVNAGDYIHLMWSATSTNVTMVAEAGNGVHPATPSIIVTLNQV
jgi:hypothetical protein